jgi:peptidylprolyl isomerase
MSDSAPLPAVWLLVISALGADATVAVPLLAATTAADWRPLDPQHTVYLELPAGRIVIELAPAFAPAHVGNVVALVREGYFDGLAILRSQDNYVVQWGDPGAEDPAGRKEIRTARRTLPAEFDRTAGADVRWTPLADGDVYAPEVGWLNELPVGRDTKQGRMWLAHCYGMVGAGRDNDPATGGGTELYVVTGHAPRHLDRNVTLLGRVVQGMELLSTLPRGGGAMGFYEKSEERVPIRAARVAADLPLDERVELELLRTDSAAFAALIAARRHRQEPWFHHSVGRVELCNVPLPVRPRVAAPPSPNLEGVDSDSR